MSISATDRVFLSKVVQDAVDDGLISDQSHNGRDVNVNMGGCSPCTVCCISGGGRSEKGEVAVVISIALFAISALVGFFYTARSARSAVQAQVNLSEARNINITDITGAVDAFSPWQTASAPQMDNYSQQQGFAFPQQTFQVSESYGQPQYPSFQAQQGYGQPYIYSTHYQQNVPFQEPHLEQFPYVPPQLEPVYYPKYQPEPTYVRSDRREVYDQAVILLEGHRNERAFAACAQGIMTIGAALLTVALLISLIVEPEIETVYLGLAGGGVGFTGLVMWLGKHACLINAREQEAARNILQMLRA